MERKGFTLHIQYHIWMQVTAVAYHTVHNRVYLGKICMSWDCEADTFYIMLGVQKEHLLKTVVYGSFE